MTAADDFNRQNPVCKLLGIKYPILQGGMANISDASLAAAVSEAGGLGIIAAGNSGAEYVAGEIKKYREISGKPFALNVMLLSPHADEVAALAAELRVPVVVTGAGNPAKYAAAWKDAGTILIPVVASVAQAKMMERLGAAAVVAEGCESGGHIGKLTTMALVPQVADGVNIPVIGAGGVADGRGLAAVFALGAAGAQIGTRFLVASECTVHQNYKNAVLKAKDIDTVVTGQRVNGACRVLKNDLSRKFDALDSANAPAEEYDALGKGAGYAAAKLGDVRNGSVFAGQIAGLVKKEQCAEEIIREIIAEYDQIASSLPVIELQGGVKVVFGANE
ncbi:MAG: nitronate monooxygenase [Defluviitaleaceae bacterium]|nr:nitronate monooxygenase [Defluviitaleaceae bacterium]